jgi:hypothetical protein
MKAMECKDRAMLDNALPYQVAVNLSDGDDDEGTLRRLYCANLNIGPGHESAVVHDIGKYIFCFANLRDANRFRSQFGGKLLASYLRMVRQRSRGDETGPKEVDLHSQNMSTENDCIPPIA